MSVVLNLKFLLSPLTLVIKNASSLLDNLISTQNVIIFLQGTIKFSDTGERTRPACIKQMQSKFEQVTR